MSLVNSPCNQCITQHHTSCTADKLEKEGYIRNAGDHCSCSRKGHPGPENSHHTPKLKAMFSKQKEEFEHIEKEIILEE